MREKERRSERKCERKREREREKECLRWLMNMEIYVGRIRRTLLCKKEAIGAGESKLMSEHGVCLFLFSSWFFPLYLFGYL